MHCQSTTRLAATLCLAALLLARGSAYAVSITEKPLAVIGLVSSTMDDGQLRLMGEAIARELSTAGFQLLAGSAVTDALEASSCANTEIRLRESCIRLVGKQLGTPYLIGGGVNVIGRLHELRLQLFSTESGREVWSSVYRVDTGIEDFYTQTPAKAAGDIPRELTVAAAPPPPPRAPAPPHVHAPAPRPVPTPGESPDGSPVSKETVDAVSPNGAAPGLVIGLSGMFALGMVTESQSPVGGKLYALYPTTEKSYARLKVGVPLYHDWWLFSDDREKNPDIYLSAEHAWSWSGFSIGVGLSYMYLQRFVLTDSCTAPYFPYLMEPYRVTYSTHHAFNLSLDLRGGRPNAGFYGRISWPLPLTIESGEPKNLFLEFSALAAFGGKRVKGGLGVMGWYKYRNADYVRQGDSTFEYGSDRSYWHDDYYEDYEHIVTREYSVLLPVARVSTLWAKHLVVNVNVELGQLFIPRPDFDAEWWQPSVGFDIVYSFGELQGADLMDGTF
jgi:hypothetical protein